MRAIHAIATAAALAAVAVTPIWWDLVVVELAGQIDEHPCCDEGACPWPADDMLSWATWLPGRAGDRAEAAVEACPSLWSDPADHRAVLCSGGNSRAEREAAFAALVDAGDLERALGWRCSAGWDTVVDKLPDQLDHACGADLCGGALQAAFPGHAHDRIYGERRREVLRHAVLHDAGPLPAGAFRDDAWEAANLLVEGELELGYSSDLTAPDWVVAIAREAVEQAGGHPRAALLLDLLGERAASREELEPIRFLAEQGVPDRYADPVDLICDRSFRDHPRRVSDRLRAKVEKLPHSASSIAARGGCEDAAHFFSSWTDEACDDCPAVWAAALPVLHQDARDRAAFDERLQRSVLVALGDPDSFELGVELLELGGHDLRYDLFSYGEDPDGQPRGNFLELTAPWARAHPAAAREVVEVIETTWQPWVSWALRRELGMPDLE